MEALRAPRCCRRVSDPVIAEFRAVANRPLRYDTLFGHADAARSVESGFLNGADLGPN
jgi:hypothetical protein